MYKWMVRVTSVGSAPSSLLSGRFMWVDLQLEASLETARINVIQWQLHSDEGLPLWRVHAHIAGVSPPTHRPGCPPTSRSAAGHGCSSALLSGEHCWSGGLRYCWLMSLILPAFFLNALLLPSPRLPLPALSLSLSCTHRSTPPTPPSYTWRDAGKISNSNRIPHHLYYPHYFPTSTPTSSSSLWYRWLVQKRQQLWQVGLVY